MCGIIAILRRPSERPAPSAERIRECLAEATAAAPALSGDLDVAALTAVTEPLERLEGLVYGPPGVGALVADGVLLADLGAGLSQLRLAVAGVEGRLDAGEVSADGLEELNAAVIRLKDALWAVERDRLRTAQAVADLAGPDPTPAAIAAFTSIQQALSALDRLEVRGRDSAGLQVLVHGHGLDLDTPAIAAWMRDRHDPLFRSHAVAAPVGHLVFVYKAAAEIGELGDNTAALRDAIRDDLLLHQALAGDGPTRWCWATPAGPAWASSLSPTPTPSTPARRQTGERRSPS